MSWLLGRAWLGWLGAAGRGGRVGDVDAGAVVLGALGLGPVHGAEELAVGVDQVQAQGVLQEGDGLSAHGSGLPSVVDQEGYGHMGYGLGRGRGRAC